MRIAVVGAGISGVAAARVLSHFGHDVVVYERSASLGGVWAVAYPEVRLQNTAEHYRLSDFPWPFEPDLHPTREQILRYITAVIEGFGLDVRTRHEVLAMHEEPDGWRLELRSVDGEHDERFDHVVLAIGQYTGAPQPIDLEGRERFAGRILVDREIHDLDVLADKRVAVVGFGKTAVDLATLAAARGSQVHHVFREPRWLIPRVLLGIHGANILFSRMSTAMIPAWVQPTAAERFLHTRMRPLVAGFWAMVATLVRMQSGLHGWHLDAGARRRMQLLVPQTPVPHQMRSAIALAPDGYFRLVMQGKIEPHRGEPMALDAHGLRLADGRTIPCELVVLSTGFTSPRFPFLPERHRERLEREPDGPQLYRHLVHPRIPRLSFAGYNHGFLHVPSVELGMLWLCAHLRGDLELPPPEEMERRIAEILAWKREHILFEPSRSCAINTRFHQYLDVLLGDLGLPPYRKANALAELLAPYTAADYAGMLDEYERSRVGATGPRRPLPLST